MPKLNVDDVRLNYNPERPQERFKAAGLAGALVKDASDRLPSSVPWPAGKAPTPTPLPAAPAATDDLTKFKGYDAVVVTWTSAEAAALAALFTPGYLTSAWYEYRHNVATYVPLSTDYYKLQGPGHRVCDMGDAMVGQALQTHPNLKWFAIRNASDPQMPNPNHDIEAASKAAAKIYSKYGAFTTAASVIASWAVIDAIIN